MLFPESREETLVAEKGKGLRNFRCHACWRTFQYGEDKAGVPHPDSTLTVVPEATGRGFRCRECLSKRK